MTGSGLVTGTTVFIYLASVVAAYAVLLVREREPERVLPHCITLPPRFLRPSWSFVP